MSRRGRGRPPKSAESNEITVQDELAIADADVMKINERIKLLIETDASDTLIKVVMEKLDAAIGVVLQIENNSERIYTVWHSDVNLHVSDHEEMDCFAD